MHETPKLTRHACLEIIILGLNQIDNSNYNINAFVTEIRHKHCLSEK